MKYATLAMVATVAATDAWALTAAHAATCVPFTTVEVKALHATNLSKTARAAAIKLLKKDAKTLTTDAATEATALATCWKDTTPPTIAKDQVAPTKKDSPCAAEWNTW